MTKLFIFTMGLAVGLALAALMFPLAMIAMTGRL